MKVEDEKDAINFNSERKNINDEISSNINLHLKWNITLTAKVKDDKNPDNKELIERKILNGVKGDIFSGETLAILGASGAGKTTLLNYLSMRLISSELKSDGETTLNSQKLKPEDFTSLSSYVMQDDVLEPEMTPREILLFTAKLKLDLPLIQIEERVQYLISKLRIDKCQNTPIGNNLKRGVSGGERKRTSIAVELLSDSPIIFLDEPTTGLDSYNAFEVVNTLNELSSMNKMVIFTIHQPASEIFPLLNKICVLALGKTVYYGSSEGIFDYFKSVKLPIKQNYNPFEHIIEVTNLSSVEEELILISYPELKNIPDKHDKYSELISAFNQEFNNNFEQKVEQKYSELDKHSKELIKSKNHNISYCYEILLLSLRLILRRMRNPKGLLLRAMQFVIFGILMTLLFNQLGRDEYSIRDRIGFMAMVTILTVFSSVSANMTICK